MYKPRYCLECPQHAVIKKNNIFIDIPELEDLYVISCNFLKKEIDLVNTNPKCKYFERVDMDLYELFEDKNNNWEQLKNKFDELSE